MGKYEMTEWVDHVTDVETGEVIQEGTPVSARLLNKMERGIYDANNETVKNTSDIVSLAVEVAVLKNAALNNFTNNVFFENFDTVDSVNIERGIYDPVNKRLYASKDDRTATIKGFGGAYE